jgi:hypothetical protein
MNPCKNALATFPLLYEDTPTPPGAFMPIKTGCGWTFVRKSKNVNDPNWVRDKQSNSVKSYVLVLAIGMAPNSLRTEFSVVVSLLSVPLLTPYTQHHEVLDPVQSTEGSRGFAQMHAYEGEPEHDPCPLHSSPDTDATGHRGKTFSQNGPEKPTSHSHVHVTVPEFVEIE